MKKSKAEQNIPASANQKNNAGKKFSARISAGILVTVIIISVALFGENYLFKSHSGSVHIDQRALSVVSKLDKQNHGSTFVFVDPGFAAQVTQNKVVLVKPIDNSLRINIDEYLHKGHDGPLYIIIPDNYAGPKEKMILKSFPGYKGWYASMVGDNYVMYAAK